MASSFEVNGKNIFDTYCDDFTNGSSSYIFPPLFSNIYTEARSDSSGNIEKSARILIKKEENRFQGICAGQSGELAEYGIFNTFYNLALSNRKSNFLLLHQLEVDIKKGYSFKIPQLKLEFPGINLSGVEEHFECDFVMLLKDVGIVLIEVKNSVSVKNITKAESQLENEEKFFNAVSNEALPSNSSPLPCLKMICVPNEPSASPKSKSSSGCVQIHKDLMDNSEDLYKYILSEIGSPSMLLKDVYKIHCIIVGLWAMMQVPAGVSFHNDKIFLSSLVDEIDEKVDKQKTSSFKEDKKKPNQKVVTNVHLQKCDGIDIICLTPDQKNLLDNFHQGIIHGPAGSGKTLLLWCKVIEIVTHDANANVVIVTTSPHHLRCLNFLQKNKISANIISTFSPPLPTAVNVFIFQFEDLFDGSKWLSYDFSQYHFFADDLHSYISSKESYFPTDVSNFLTSQYDATSDRYLWLCMDISQSHLSRKQSFPKLPMPTFTLNHILRNSLEIANLVIYRHQKYLDRKKLPQGTSFTTSPSVGHTITAVHPKYHKLEQKTKSKFKESFLLHILKIELEQLQIGKVNPCDIAILFDRHCIDLMPKVNSFLQTTYTYDAIDIKQTLQKLQSSNQIIVDETVNCASFEAKVVFNVIDNSSSVDFYVLASRARCLLFVVDLNVWKPSSKTETIRLVVWEENGGSFEKK